MSLIRIDYENARAQARQLEQSEQQCSQIAQSIQALRQQLAGVWAGEAADTYDQAAERRLREIRKIQDELSRLAHTIRKGKVRRVIVYKLDRISRSILDFATMMELFQEYDVEFVSSTLQTFL